MSEETNKTEDPTLVEKWLADQQEWQKVMLEYMDSMVKNDDFVVNLGNAMRGSLLAGKPYPTSKVSEAETEADDSNEQLDKILFALHQLQGEVSDLRSEIADLRDAHKSPASAEQNDSHTGEYD